MPPRGETAEGPSPVRSNARVHGDPAPSEDGVLLQLLLNVRRQIDLDQHLAEVEPGPASCLPRLHQCFGVAALDTAHPSDDRGWSGVQIDQATVVEAAAEVGPSDA